MAALVSATERDYSRSKWTLLFNDAAVEAEYVRFMYVDSGAYGPKMYAFAAAGIWVLIMLWFHHRNLAPRTISSAMWAEGPWIAAVASFAINIVAFALLFVPALGEYREWIFFVLLASHWPGIASGALLAWHKDGEGRTSLMYITGCLPFCMLVALTRFIYTITTILVSTVGTYIVVCFVVDGGSYFDTHSYFEVWLWAMPLFTGALLPVFERRSRDAFVETRRARAAVDLVEHQVASMRFAVAALFPPTPTLLALAQRKGARDAAADAVAMHALPDLGSGAFVMADTCVVQTDIAGFTAFASRATMAEVIGTVGQVFAVMDAAAATHGVEKVHTVGDCFVGAVFAPAAATAAVEILRRPCDAPTSCAPDIPLEERALAIMQFALAAKDAASQHHGVQTLPASTPSLKIRVGVHIGAVVAALVGAIPPKCDLFDLPGAAQVDATVSHAALLEATGRPGYVHASNVLLAALHPAAGVVAAEEADDGGDGAATPHGRLLCSISIRLTDADGNDDENDGSFREDADGKSTYLRASPLTVGRVVASLEDVVAANAADVADMLIDRTTDSAAAAASLATRERADHDDRSSNKSAPRIGAGDDSIEELTRLNLFTLRFKNADTEHAYVDWLRGTSLLRKAQTALAAQGIAFLVAEMGLAPCPSTGTDRAHTMFAATGLLWIAGIVHGGVVPSKHFLLVIPTIYTAIGCGATLMLSTSCLAKVDPDRSVADSGGGAEPTTWDVKRAYVGTIATMWFVVQGMLSVPLCVDQPMLLRVAVMSLVSLVIAPGSYLLRQAIIGDDVLKIHLVFITVLIALCTAGYFADLALRRGFAATLDMRTVLTSQRGRLAATVAKASDVMLPPFVNRAIAQSKARSSADATHPAASDSGGNSNNDGGEGSTNEQELLLVSGDPKGTFTDPSSTSQQGDIPSQRLEVADGTATATTTTHTEHEERPPRVVGAQHTNSALETASKVAAHRWHFDFPLPVCFVTFERVAAPNGGGGSDRAAHRFHEVALVALAESAAKRCNASHCLERGVGVHKVKSIGNRVLFVAGLEAATRHADAKGECARPPGQHTLGDAVAALVDVALDLGASARAPSGAVAEAVGGPERVSVTAGIHCGPCFGAVLGLKRAVFDVFGDGVNTASRMESTAVRGSVQLSEVAAQLTAERSALGAGRRRNASGVGVGWSVEAAGTVDAKGKGVMARFVVRPTNSKHQANGNGGGASREAAAPSPPS